VDQVLSTISEVEARYGSIIQDLRKRGYSYSTRSELHVKLLDQTRALASGVFVRHKTDGSELETMGTTYIRSRSRANGRLWWSWAIHQPMSFERIDNVRGTEGTGVRVDQIQRLFFPLVRRVRKSLPQHLRKAQKEKLANMLPIFVDKRRNTKEKAGAKFDFRADGSRKPSNSTPQASRPLPRTNTGNLRRRTLDATHSLRIGDS
jgi:hypothetical protein